MFDLAQFLKTFSKLFFLVLVSVRLSTLIFEPKHKPKPETVLKQFRETVPNQR